jgi:hypothetical protein
VKHHGGAACPSSLRAKRSNPEGAIRAGLLRRFAPRKDDS